MKALSIRQPWAWAILHAGKRIENRDWKACHYRGPLLLHASKGCTLDEYSEASEWMRLYKLAVPAYAGGTIPPWREAKRGGIVGVCRVVGTVGPDGRYSEDLRPHPDLCPNAREQRCESPWWQGGFGLVLADVRPLPFVPFKGALGFFDVPDDLLPAEARRP